MEIPGRRSFLKVMAGSPALLTYGCAGLGAAKAVGRQVSRDRQAGLDKYFDMERFLKLKGGFPPGKVTLIYGKDEKLRNELLVKVLNYFHSSTDLKVHTYSYSSDTVDLISQFATERINKDLDLKELFGDKISDFEQDLIEQFKGRGLYFRGYTNQRKNYQDDYLRNSRISGPRALLIQDFHKYQSESYLKFEDIGTLLKFSSLSGFAVEKNIPAIVSWNDEIDKKDLVSLLNIAEIDCLVQAGTEKEPDQIQIRFNRSGKIGDCGLMV
jgi:hypothetical protein